MKHLNINLNEFPFYARELSNGKTVMNRCGRDFLYYTLVYFRPTEHGEGKLMPIDLEKNGHFGIGMPALFAWMQIQFLRVPQYFKKQGLLLSINQKSINSFSDFVRAILFSKMNFEDALFKVESSIDKGNGVGIDISIALGGLLDHVMYVYGYDKENLYVFETGKAPIEYESISDEFPKIMKLPKTEIKKRWTRFGRVWEVKEIER